MKVDTGGDFFADPMQVEAAAARAEAQGYDGAQVAETRHDAFVGLTLAARATRSVELLTAPPSRGTARFDRRDDRI